MCCVFSSLKQCFYPLLSLFGGVAAGRYGADIAFPEHTPCEPTPSPQRTPRDQRHLAHCRHRSCTKQRHAQASQTHPDPGTETLCGIKAIAKKTLCGALGQPTLTLGTKRQHAPPPPGPQRLRRHLPGLVHHPAPSLVHERDPFYVCWERENSTDGVEGGGSGVGCRRPGQNRKGQVTIGRKWISGYGLVRKCFGSGKSKKTPGSTVPPHLPCAGAQR